MLWAEFHVVSSLLSVLKIAILVLAHSIENLLAQKRNYSES